MDAIMSEAMPSVADERTPVAEIELGLSIEQAWAIVQEFDVLWRAAPWYGKKHLKELLTVRNTLAHTLRTEKAP